MHIKYVFSLKIGRLILLDKKQKRNEWGEKGYFILENFFSEADINNIKKEIPYILNNKNILTYKDRNKKIRRIEKFIATSHAVQLINIRLQKILKDILSDDYCLFKDKINFKPPGGEGFFAHYDGVFKFEDTKENIKRGWYEYADHFLNALVLLDDFDINNGPLELARHHEGGFDKLYENTKKNGTPDLTVHAESNCTFYKVKSLSGSVLIFSNTCPHRSSSNQSKNDRGSLYLTYNKAKYGNNYNKYFIDKISSTNKKSKSLSGPLK